MMGEVVMKRVITSFGGTLFISLWIHKLWKYLEMEFYGEVQYRVVDDVIMIILMVILFFAIYFFQSYIETKEYLNHILFDDIDLT